jgi:hypothetical protein
MLPRLLLLLRLCCVQEHEPVSTAAQWGLQHSCCIAATAHDVRDWQPHMQLVQALLLLVQHEAPAATAVAEDGSHMLRRLWPSL